MPIPPPQPFAVALAEATKRLVARTPAELAEREFDLRVERARHEREHVALACRTRGVPADANVRRAVLADHTALTKPLQTILAALTWRSEHRLPTGERPGLVVVLAGGNGSGKTVGCSWVVARSETSALLLTANDLGQYPDTDWGAYVEVRERWASVGLLVIDDVGAERSEKAAKRVVERCGPLLLGRYDAGLATFLTTNRPAEEFTDGYLSTEETVIGGPRGELHGSARLASRLEDAQDGGGCPWWYELHAAPTFRGPAGAARLAALPTVDGGALRGLL